MRRDKPAAYDTGRFISVDKPPVALCAKLGGCIPFALLNQQVTGRFAPFADRNGGGARVRSQAQADERTGLDGPMAR